MCHISCFTRHMSHVMCHVLYVNFYIYIYFFTKCWSLSVEGLLSMRPTLSSLKGGWPTGVGMIFTRSNNVLLLLIDPIGLVIH